MEQLLKNLQSYDDEIRRDAVIKIKEIGESAFVAVADLLQHEVAKWEAVSLLPVLSPTRAIVYLLQIVNFERQKSVTQPEHAKKYFRIKGIQELGNIGKEANEEILSLFRQYQVEAALGFFIHPQRPHCHKEVIDVVIRALQQIDTDDARKFLERWQQK